MADIKIIRKDVNVGYPDGEDPVPISGLATQAVPGMNTTIYYGAAVDPYIVVSPKNPCVIIVAWQNDRLSTKGALEAGIAYSHNRGKSWCRVVVPFQITIGGVVNRITQPSLAYSADGARVFLTVMAANTTRNPESITQSGIATSYSDDDGVTWGKPVFNISEPFSIEEGTVDDLPTITADPKCANNIYVVWERFVAPRTSHANTYLSRSNDKGASWFPAVAIYDATFDLKKSGLSNGKEADNQTLFNTVVPVENNLYNYMTRIYASPNATSEQYANDTFPYKYTDSDIAFIVSKDNGISWGNEAKVVTTTSYNASVFTGGYCYDINGNIVGGIGTLVRTGSPGAFAVA
ncbi:MAG: exo-alpha-sialidase, partial [Harvfovirus sp.]